MDIESITSWEAKRAGGRITVYGTDSTNKKTKIVGVDSIRVINGRVVATDLNKVDYHLVVD